MAALLPLRPLCPLRTPGGHSGREAEAVLSAELSPICSSSVPNPDKRRRDARPEPGRGRLGRARAVTILGAPELSNPAARRPPPMPPGSRRTRPRWASDGWIASAPPSPGSDEGRGGDVVKGSVPSHGGGLGPGVAELGAGAEGSRWPHPPSGVRRRGSGPRSRRSSGAAPDSSEHVGRIPRRCRAGVTSSTAAPCSFAGLPGAVWRTRNASALSDSARTPPGDREASTSSKTADTSVTASR